MRSKVGRLDLKLTLKVTITFDVRYSECLMSINRGLYSWPSKILLCFNVYSNYQLYLSKSLRVLRNNLENLMSGLALKKICIVENQFREKIFVSSTAGQI